MVNFTNSDKEKLFDANNLARQKVTALGADGYSHNEPFPREPVLPLARIMRQNPTLDGYGTTAPNFDDYPFAEGAIGTRYSEVRLHSYLPSSIGDDGYSCQTFFVVSAAPASNSIDDLSAVRIKPLIGPEYSPGRTNAAKVDPSLRGFELALYPAIDSGGTLVADTSNGPISPVADPGASSSGDSGAGAGSDGFWSVDYENGIVRFSRPPVSGSTGVMNPNNTSGDVDGNYTPGAAITMFATFYKYDGEFGIADDPDLVTVGDGYVSTGAFTGAGFNVLQAAIDSLPGEGGTVFIKEGQYDYVDSVIIPQKVSVVGLNGVNIIRPRREPAFIFADGYSSLEGVEIQARDGLSNGGAIELRSESASQTMQEITIKNNVIYAESDAYGIAFAPILATPTYMGLKIIDNVFKPNGSNPIYIGEINRGTTASVQDCVIDGNDFQLNDSNPSRAIWLPGGVVDSFETSTIINNNATNSEIEINVTTDPTNSLFIINNRIANLLIGNVGGIVADGARILGNIISNLTMGTFTNSILSDNEIFSVTIAGMSASAVTENNVTSTFDITGGVASGSSIDENIIGGAFTIGGAVNTSSVSRNTITGIVTINSLSSAHVIGNKPGADFTVTTTISASRVEDNQISGVSTFLTTELTTNSYFCRNTVVIFSITGSSNNAVLDSFIEDNVFAWSASVSSSGSLATVSGSVISGNNVGGTIAGDLDIDNTGTGNVLENSLVERNIMSTAFNLGATVLSSENRYVVENTIVSGNTVGTNIVGAHAARVATEMTYVNSTFSNNIVTGSMTLNGAMDNTVINDGYVGTDLVVDNSIKSIIFGNIIDNDLTIYALDNSSVSYNRLGNNSIVSNTTDTSNFNNNNTGNVLQFLGNVDGSFIRDNYSNNTISVTGEFNLSSLISNVASAAITLSTNSTGGTVNGSIVKGNMSLGSDLIIDNTSSTGNVLDSSIVSENRVFDDLALGLDVDGSEDREVMLESIVSQNRVNGDLICGNSGRTVSLTTYSESIISENRIRGDATLNGLTEDCIVSDNIIEGILTSDDITDTNLVGNIAGTFTPGIITGTNLMGNVVSTNNAAQSVSCHIADGYVTVDTGNRLTGQIGTVIQHVGAILTTSTALTSSTTATQTFDKSVWIPSGVLRQGSTIRVVASGVNTAKDGAETLILKINLGANTKKLAQTVQKLPDSNGWIFYMDATCVVELGLGTNIPASSIGNSFFNDEENTESGGFRVDNGDNNGINTLGALEVTVTAKWSANGGSSSAFLDLLTVWVT